MEEIERFFEALGIPKIAAAFILMALAGLVLTYRENFFGFKLDFVHYLRKQEEDIAGQ